MSKEEMRNILRRTGWKLTRTIDSKGAAYIGIIVKQQHDEI
jgi:hypothetical protein